MIYLVLRVHAFGTEGSGCILYQSDVVAKLHTKATGGFNAGVRYEADQNDFLDPTLFELRVDVGIGEAALRPVLMHDDVSIARDEFGMELPASGSGGASAVSWVRS